MTEKQIMKIFDDTAYVHTSGTAEELKCAEYLKERCLELGLKTSIEPFEIKMRNITKATLTADGADIPCEGYGGTGSGEVEGELYYLTDEAPFPMSLCKGKVVLYLGRLRKWFYKDVVKAGALAVITADGNVYFDDHDIDKRELSPTSDFEEIIPCVHIHVKDAVKLVENNVKHVKICLEQQDYMGHSHNVVALLEGETSEEIVFTAHYDTTPLAPGSYDNMSGCVGMLGVAEYFKDRKPKRTLRFVFCGSEERGLHGSKAYTEQHDLSNVVLNINIDCIGTKMGRFVSCCTTEDATVGYISYLGLERGYQIHTYKDIYSSDSTPFADHGVPAVSFARHAPGNVTLGHSRHDTPENMSGRRMIEDTEFVIAFTDRMANAVVCPVKREIPNDLKEKLEIYMGRKRK